MRFKNTTSSAVIHRDSQGYKQSREKLIYKTFNTNYNQTANICCKKQHAILLTTYRLYRKSRNHWLSNIKLHKIISRYITYNITKNRTRCKLTLMACNVSCSLNALSSCSCLASSSDSRTAICAATSFFFFLSPLEAECFICCS